MKLFDLDGPFQRYGTYVFDILFLNTLWLIISIFSFGLLGGPALTAIYSGMYAGVVTSEGYTFKQFFKRFKRRFVPSLILGLLFAFFIGLSSLTLFFILPNYFGHLSTFLYIAASSLYLFIMIEVIFVSSYIYPLLALTDLKTSDVLKTAFFLANKHLPTTVLASFINAIALLTIFLIFVGYVQLFVFLFFGMGIIVLINSFLITKRILSKYEFFIEPER
jgi:uncharacterized membrane protein YesL